MKVDVFNPFQVFNSTVRQLCEQPDFISALLNTTLCRKMSRPLSQNNTLSEENLGL